jgi:hypothetical protein
LLIAPSKFPKLIITLRLHIIDKSLKFLASITSQQSHLYMKYCMEEAFKHVKLKNAEAAYTKGYMDRFESPMMLRMEIDSKNTTPEKDETLFNAPSKRINFDEGEEMIE